MCHSIVLCQSCNKCQNCRTKSACRGETSNLLANLAGSGCRSESTSNPERGLLPPLSDPAKTHKVSHSHKLLCQYPQEKLPVGGITSAYRQKRSRTGSKSNISVFGPKAKQQMETYTRPKQTKSLPQGGEIQKGDTGNHQDISPTRGVGHLNRLQRRLLPYTNTGTVQEISEISCPGLDIPIQGTDFWSVHSALGVQCGSKRGETDGHTQGYKDPPVPRRLVGESQIPPGLSPVYTGSSKICQELGWLVNVEKSELEPKQVFNFVGYQFDLKSGRVRPTPDRWQNLQEKLLKLLSLPTCPVREFMSSIGLLTATEKQVYLCHLHMRPIQWHLKNNWRVPESLEKVIPIPRSLHPHLQWWLEEENVLTGQPLHPIKHALQIFTDASKEGWGAHLNELPRTHGSFSSFKRVPKSLLRQDSTGSHRQHDSSVVHKQGRRHEVGHILCPTVENLDLVYQKPSDSQSQTHSRPTECGSRQAIQVRPDHTPCKRIILIAPGWPNMPWFWDLVAMSSQIPLSLPILPNLLTQPFNQIPHKNLASLNLHAWLLEPQQSRSKVSLRQWQQELRLLRGDQPDQSMRQSGPFLQSGASLIRWTSGHPCKVSS